MRNHSGKGLGHNGIMIRILEMGMKKAASHGDGVLNATIAGV